ncbi:hypothetical protein LZP73_13245 [Shewanella sp. AS16]|uniref:hypothetical protein n=1 Tax=Shewanella sp. AS16 TaxID=2907625 RepID=UPI001F22DB17|nr:hypothetical protein [Shewanella sp. AS16]MCE9687158.1 hypothetical protein [Shewanella sp. AS16]
MSKLVIGLIVFLWGMLVANASSQSGIVTSIQVRDDGLHWIYLNGARDERPACASGQVYWMIKDENSLYGKSQFSLLLTAYAAKSPVSIIGKGSCTRWGDGEDIGTVQLR